MRKVFFTMAAIAATMLTVTSCSKNNDEIEEDSKVALCLASGVETQLRAAFTDADTQIASGEAGAVYVDEAGGTPQLYGNNLLTANGSGGLSGGTAMYFPQNGANMDIYALHTNATLDNVYPATALTIAIDKEISTDFTTGVKYNAAVIVPQTVASGGELFITLITHD